MVAGPQFQHEEQADLSRSEPANATPSDGAASALLQLQRAAGNRALADLILQRKCIPAHKGPARSHGVSMSALATEWGATGMATELILSADGIEGAESLIPLGTMKSNQSVTHGAEHAEDIAIRTLRTNAGLFKPAPAVNRLWMSITKSPCTSVSRNGGPATSTKAVGCTEELINLATAGLTVSGTTYNFAFTVHVYGLYAPQVPGYTQAEVLQASQDALDALAGTPGITVTGDVRTGSSSRFGAK